MQLSRIGRRPSRKRQAVDNVASLAKVWSEWQLAKRAGQGVAKGAKTAGKAAIVWRVLPMRMLILAGGAAAGIGALRAWRRRRGDAEPWAPPADDASPPPAATGPSVPAPAAPGSGPERIKVTSDPAAAVQAAQEGSNGAAQLSDPPAAAPEAEPAEQSAPEEEPAATASEAEAVPDPGAETDKPQAEADTTKVSEKPADA